MSLKLLSNLPFARPGGDPGDPTDAAAETTLALVGNPNVGKSVVFHRLTGAYVTVSNYPGTTVEVSRGHATIGERRIAVVDTPGMYSLSPITAEERVARRLLLAERPALVVQVVDAKNLRRMLPLTLELIEAGFRLALDLNVMDEAEELGISINLAALGDELGIPTVGTVSTSGRGLESLRAVIGQRLTAAGDSRAIAYDPDIEQALHQMVALLSHDYGASHRAIALMLLQGDDELAQAVAAAEPAASTLITEIVMRAQAASSQPMRYRIAAARQRSADRIAERTSVGPTRHPAGGRALLSRLMMTPITGLPLLALVLYFGLYKFVGQVGAGLGVELLEGRLFDGYLNPLVTRAVTRILPWEWANSLIVGDFGIFTLGVKYAVGILLPVVASFFLVFALIEDSGYLPRLAMLLDRAFKAIGLSGRAVIPMVLGLGCDTMATMVTRVLETTRERVIATLLLALAVPCSAQLGVILALLSRRPLALVIWAGVVGGVFLLVGFLSSRLMPGDAASFYMEIPPLRWPSLRNIAAKTYARVEWYLLEVLPVFVLASVIIWIGRLTHLFQLAVSGMEHVVQLIGLPPSAGVVFLFGFFRRDYGAAGLYELQSHGGLTGVQLVVAMVTLTLFLPCIAQALIMCKERGLKTTLAIAGFIVPCAFGVGYLLNLTLSGLGVKL